LIFNLYTYIFIYAALKRLATPSDFRIPYILEDPECYAGGSIAAGRVSFAGQDEDESSDEERYSGPPGWGLRRWTNTLTLGKMFSSLKPYTKTFESDFQFNGRK
jgi:hypothetical protein